MQSIRRLPGQERGSRLRVLYVEMAAGAGGSVTGLYRLLQGLDRDRFEPLVMLHKKQPLTPLFRELGVEIVELPTPFAKVRKPELGRAAVTPRDPLSLWERVRVRAVPPPSTLAQPKVETSVYDSARFYFWFVRRSLPSAWPMRNIIARRQIDVVHLNDDVAFNRSGIAAAALAGVPCIAHVRFFFETRGIDRLLSRFTSYYIYMSRALEAYTRERFSRARGSVVYDGLTEDYFAPLPDKAAARHEFGLAPEDFVVGSLGRLVEWKGHRVLLKALAEVAPSVPNLKCIVVGDPDPPTDTSYLEELKRMSTSLGLGAVVKFVGFRSDVKGALSAMDVLVHSSSEPEPFGLVIIEGMAAGKPVIATGAGGVLDIIADEETGLLVPVNDSSSMARAIAKLADLGAAGRRDLGKAARRSAGERFTMKGYVEGVMDAYEQVLMEKKRTSCASSTTGTLSS